MDEGDALRQQRAAEMLRGGVLLGRIREQIRALDASEQPKVAVIAGGERLFGVSKLGVLAGSFNPPTRAHVALAESARQHGGCEVVLWTISRVTVDKERVTRAPLDLRLATLVALTSALPHDAVACINRGLYADQAQAVRVVLPHLRDLAFIIGYDKIVQILDPHYYTDRDAALDALFGLAEVLVAPRDDEGERDLAALMAQSQNRRWANRVRFIPLDPALRRISSTEARERIARNQPIADLVPPEALALVAAGGYA